MIHQIGHKLKEQIHQFSGELSTGLGKVASRFVEEMIYGISAGGPVVLTKIARSLDEPIRLHDTHKRLSGNLANEAIKDEIGAKVLAKGARRIGNDTLLIVDPTDLIKNMPRKWKTWPRSGTPVKGKSATATGCARWLARKLDRRKSRL